jgi:hypothetical protein
VSNHGTRSTGRTVGCRVTSEEYQEVEEAARITESSISDYLRHALFAETNATAAALEEARRRGYEEARSDAHYELTAVKAQLIQARQAAASWQQRGADLERNLVISSQRLVMAVSRVLWSAPRARAELTRVWACLNPADQQRVLPAVTECILEELERIRDEVSSMRYTRERDAETLTNAAWLHRLLIGAGRELPPPRPSPRIRPSPMARGKRKSRCIGVATDRTAPHSTLG